MTLGPGSYREHTWARMGFLTINDDIHRPLPLLHNTYNPSVSRLQPCTRALPRAPSLNALLSFAPTHGKSALLLFWPSQNISCLANGALAGRAPLRCGMMFKQYPSAPRCRAKGVARTGKLQRLLRHDGCISLLGSTQSTLHLA
jgi:hypothetical protein